MLVHVYGMKTAPFREEKKFEKALQEVSADRRDRILTCKAEGEKCRLLAAGVLLCRVLKMYGYDKYILGSGQKGKPYLEGVEGFHFNLSHSGEYVVCATGRKPVGVDIQEFRKGTEKIPGRFFLETEKEDIEHAEEGERQTRFFRYWTAKESYGKLTGKGLAQGFDRFFVDLERGRILDLEEPGRKIYLKEYSLERNIRQQRYALSVCSYAGEFSEKIEEITFEER